MAPELSAHHSIYTSLLSIHELQVHYDPFPIYKIVPMLLLLLLLLLLLSLFPLFPSLLADECSDR